MNKYEIKKALECCQDYDYESCVDCPYRKHSEDCTNDILRDALDLITEQEKEIERVNKELSEKEEYHRMTQALCHSYRNDYWKTFQRLEEQQQEIERLKAENEKRLTCDFVKTAQKHAKIDVLNQLKEKINSAPNGWAYTTYIDEMIEEVEND